MHGGAMEPWNWTEAKQMKWNMRSMIGDAARQLVSEWLFAAVKVASKQIAKRASKQTSS